MTSIPKTISSDGQTWKSWLLEPIRETERIRDSNSGDSKRNSRAWCGLLGGTVCLLLLRFLFLQDEQGRWVEMLRWAGADFLAEWLRGELGHPLGRLAFWMIGCLICYAVIPFLLIRFVVGECPKTYGWCLPRWRESAVFVAVAGCVMLPLVWFASAQSRFLWLYPFYEPAREGFPGMDFLIWEVLYALQFLALEFFFRGFLVHATAPVMGAWAIPMMVLPYCMIHFQKPFLEASASILAGLALGWLGLKTRSVLPGAVLHILVAWTMDCTSLWRKGYFE